MHHTFKECVERNNRKSRPRTLSAGSDERVALRRKPKSERGLPAERVKQRDIMQKSAIRMQVSGGGPPLRRSLTPYLRSGGGGECATTCGGGRMARHGCL